MGPTMRPASHRIPVKLPSERSLEEVILATKMTAPAEVNFPNSTSERHTSAGGQIPTPQRGMLASPSSPASFLSHLPPEAHVREVSSRLGKRRRSNAARRATPERTDCGDNNVYGGRGPSLPLPQSLLRPLTGVSPPSTAQSAFSVADFANEAARPTTSSRSPLRGNRTMPWGFDNGNVPHSSDKDYDTRDSVSFLTDKCNALARRLHQVEKQLFRERADNKALPSGRGGGVLLSSRSTQSRSRSSRDNYNISDFAGKRQRPLYSRGASSADPNPSPRGSCASSCVPSQNLPKSTPAQLGGRGGNSAAGMISGSEAGEKRRDKANLTSGSVRSSSSCSLDNRAKQMPFSEEKGMTYARQRDQEDREQHRSSGSRYGIMVPPDVVQAIRDRGKPRRNDGDKMDADALHCEMVEKEIADRFEIVTGGIEKLEDVFSGAAQILEHRVRAIATISSTIRMFLQRCRYLRGKEALRAWRTSHSLRVLQFMRQDVFRQKKIEAGLESLQNRHRLSVMSKMFRWWSTVVGTNEQRNYQLKMLEEKVKRRQLFDLTRDVFRGLKDQTIGPSSSRELARRGLRRQQEARERVVKKAVARGEMGLYVTDAMVRQEMSRQAVELMQGRVEVNLSRSVLARLKQAILLRKKREITARMHFKRWAYRRAMKGWRRWAALKADGMDRKLMTGYKGGERLRYNPNKVAAFARRREMLTVFLAWGRKSSQLAIATRMQRKKLTAVMVTALDTWKAETKKTKQVKNIAVGMWADFSLKDLGEPFRMWYIYADFSKKQTKEHERLLRLYRRAKNRKMTHGILKAWKHLAVYGRIEGMYTRSQLMASLAEQKEHTSRLVGKVDELAGGLGDMEELAMEYRSQMISRQKETTEREGGMDRQAMALHHAEQEIVRLQCLLASAAEVAPHVCKAIHNVAPHFDFKERGLQPYTKARAQALEVELEVRVEGMVARRIAEQAAAAKSKQNGNSSMPNSERAGYPTTAAGTDNGNNDTGENPKATTLAAGAGGVVTADAQTQVWLPADPEATARAAVAAAALAQGTDPPILPKELVRLDRVEWVMRRTSVAEVAARLKKQREEDGLDDDGGIGPGVPNASRASGGGAKNGRNPENGLYSLAMSDHSGTPPVDGGSLPPTIDGVNRGKHAISTNDGGGGAEEDDGEEDDVADRLAAVFEFLRSGNSLLLPPDLRADWESRPDIGLGLLSADDHEDHLQQQLSYNLTAGGGGRKGVSAWARGLCREATGGNGEPMTYHDLRMALNATVPRGRRSETTNDLLERRLAERRNRADEMATALWGNGRPGLAENLYRPSTAFVAAK
ncbi:unnamed protein product [Scytosiphon promiscuus]